MIINTSNSQAKSITPTWVSIKSGEPIAGHNQYRATVEVTEFKSEFSKDIWKALVKSGRKNLANKYATDIPHNQRCILFNGLMEYDESTEKGRKFAKAYGNKPAQIDDFKFPRFGNIYGTENANDWWEKAIQEIRELIGKNGWVQINGVQFRDTGVNCE